MPRRGEVRVLLCRRWCTAVASFMGELVERPEDEPSWMVSAEEIRLNRVRAGRLRAVMTKAAARKRPGTGFVVNLDRELAAFFAHLHRPLGRDFRAIFRAQIAFAAAVKTRRGPRRLSMQGLEDRTQGKVHRNLEHTIRLRRRLRYEEAFAEWITEITARGETILTTSIPFPKI